MRGHPRTGGTAAPLASPETVAATAVLGLVVLATRTVEPASLPMVLAVGAVGILAPTLTEAPAGAWTWFAATAAGLLGFAIVATTVASPAPGGAGGLALWTAVVAAAAEEAFFRRFLYGWFLRWGVGMAVLGSAVLFAAAHLPAYGWPGAALDLAAGLVFGWQRWTTGTWTAPAVTHVAANLMAVGG